MRLFKASLLALVASLAFVSASEDTKESAEATKSDVVDLNAESFKEFVKTNPLSLVEFFAPWCGHCKALAPEYEIAATTLKTSDIPIAKVDCTVEEELCKEQDVKGFPTLKVFRDGDVLDYKGPRKADGIVEYMKKQALPSISVFLEDSAAKLNAFIKSGKVVVVGFFDDDKSKPYRAFIQVAHKHRDDWMFGASFDKDSLKEHEAKPNTIVIFKDFDNKKDVKQFDVSKKTNDLYEEFIAYIKENSIPLMDEIGPENYSNYVERGLPIAYLFYSSKKERDEQGEEVEAVAKKFKGKLSFVYIDAEKFASHADNLNLKRNWPGFAIQEPKEDLKYAYEDDITEKALTSYIQAFLDGHVSPTLKSAKIPETNDEPVKVVVGESFEKIVLDKTKDVLFEVYAPWCGHCKALEPIYVEAAEKLQSHKKIVLAKMDGTENDLPQDAGFKIAGFPTIKLFTAKDNKMIDFDGERTLVGIAKFLKENAVNGADIDVEALQPKEEAKEDTEEVKEEKAEEKKEEKKDEEHDEL